MASKKSTLGKYATPFQSWWKGQKGSGKNGQSTWDWGVHDPENCGALVVGFKKAGKPFRVETCHRSIKTANKKLLDRYNGLKKMASKPPWSDMFPKAGVKLQVRDKHTGKVVRELVLKPSR